MPRVAVPVTPVTRAGVVPANEVNGDPVNNHSVVNDGKVWLEVRNADAAVVRNLTVKFTTDVDGQVVTSRTYALPANMTAPRKFGPWPPQWYGQSIQVDVDNAALKLTAYRID